MTARPATWVLRRLLARVLRRLDERQLQQLGYRDIGGEG